MKTCAIIGVCVILAFSRSTSALADQEDNDALQIRHAKISLPDAVAVAEAKTGGRASKAEFEQAKEGWVFDVETVSGKEVNDVHVDAQTGVVLSVTADTIGQDKSEEDEAGLIHWNTSAGLCPVVANGAGAGWVDTKACPARAGVKVVVLAGTRVRLASMMEAAPRRSR